MMRDWTGFRCGPMEILRCIASVPDGKTKRAAWLYADTRTGNRDIIRSNEIMRRCKGHIEHNSDDGSTFYIKRYNGSKVDYLTDTVGVFYFGKKTYAKKLKEGSAKRMIDRLSQDWPGYNFSVEKT